MTLLHGTDALHDAARNRRALAGLVAYNLETVQAIIAAAEQTGLPLILQAGSSAFKHAGRETLAALAVQAARRSPASIGVHLDHSRDLDEIAACIRAGYTSIMFDGSHLPFDQNVAHTRAAAVLAHDAGVWIEAELGSIAGDEDVSTDAVPHTSLTDPGQAAEFVAATGVDALAVSVGTVHGNTTRPIHLDLHRLEAIHSATPVPLVLHGASGVPTAQLSAVIARGVAKINVNTELRSAYLEAVADLFPQALSNSDAVATWTVARTAVMQTAARIVTLFAGRLGDLQGASAPE